MKLKRKLSVLLPVAAFVLFFVFTAVPAAVFADASELGAVSVVYYNGVYTRGFTWRTSQTVTNGYVQIVEKTGAATKQDIDWDALNNSGAVIEKAAESSGLPANASGFAVNTKVWKVNYTFTSAADGRTYFYRVGSPQGWSQTGEQKIDGGGNGVKLIHLTDSHVGFTSSSAGYYKQTLEKADLTHPGAQAVIHTGDIVDYGGNAVYWNAALGASSVLMDTVTTPVTGNHDGAPSYSGAGMNAAHYNIAVPAGQTDDGQFYSYNIGNVHIAVLNTNRSFASAQVNWLKDDLAAAEGNPHIRWKIIALHTAFVSSGPGSDSTGGWSMREIYLPIMTEYKVDLVLQGHDHVYTRSNPLLWNGNGDTAATSYDTEAVGGVNYMFEPKGTSYVLINTAADKQYSLATGSSLAEFLRPGTNALATNPLTGQAASAQPNAAMFGAITVDNTGLLYESYTVNRSTGVTALYDYFGVIKDFSAEVSQQIAALPDTFSLQYAGDIIAAYRQYDALIPAVKARVSGELAAKIQAQYAQVDAAAYNEAKPVINAISGIVPDEFAFTAAFKVRLDGLAAEYGALSAGAKPYVYNYGVLTGALEWYALKEAEAGKGTQPGGKKGCKGAAIFPAAAAVLAALMFFRKRAA